MAVVYSNSSFTTWATASSVLIAKPSGLLEGDLMIAHIGWQSDSGAVAITPKTDWTDLNGVANQVSQQTVSGGGGFSAAIQIRVATAADVVATNYTWNIASSVNNIAGAIFLIRGQASTPIGAFNSAVVTNTASPSFANTITPTTANSLLLMLLVAQDTGLTGTPSTSGYAIATSNPTWTERYDLTVNNTADPVLAAATASRPQITATGNSSLATGGGVTTDSICFLIAVSPAPDPVLTPASITVTTTVQTPALAVSTNLSPATITVTTTVNVPTISMESNLWTNVPKNSTSWTNVPKN